MRKSYFVGAALLLLWSAPLPQAAIVFSDSFGYSNGSLVSVSGGTWVNQSGTIGEVNAVSGRVFLTQSETEDVSAELQGQPYAPTNGSWLYASFTVNFTNLPVGSNGSYFFHFRETNSGGAFHNRIYAATNGAPAGSFRLGIANQGTSVPSIWLPNNLSLNTDYRIVTRHVLSNAVSTLWLNPSAESDAGVMATDVPANMIDIGAIALRQASGIGGLFLDDLLVGSSFSDVVANSAPVITAEPTNQTAFAGGNATFIVGANGTPPLSYQWQFNGTNLVTGTTSMLSLTNVSAAQAGTYSVAVFNSLGATNSQPATLTVNPTPDPPFITVQPQSQTVTESSNVTFSVTATGTAPLSYQWQFNGANLPGATLSELVLANVSPLQAGSYAVTITNVAGSTNSQPATLSVTPLAMSAALTYLTYNVKGNGAVSWTTNTSQVQAIGRQVMYLNPDVITFNEIPNQFVYEMTNFVTAFLPGYYLATNSATDGFIRSVIVSRFPIFTSVTHLHSADLNPYGYTNANFTRDLFEARIAVPGFPQPLHVFTTHLKSGQGTDDSHRRGAEASAISNYLVTVFLPDNSTHPYVLSGDLNEDIDDPPSSDPKSIQRLANPATGLQLTTPVNPVTGSQLTFSIQNTNGLTNRYDYVLPCGLLFSNINSSQVFRTDLLTNPPPPLTTNDDKLASDHLPVVMVFGNPYTKPFRVTSISRSNQTVSLRWQSVLGQPYRVENSSNLTDWSVLAANVLAGGPSLTFSTNVAAGMSFFRIYRLP